jgi:hypothetical protein
MFWNGVSEIFAAALEHWRLLFGLGIPVSIGLVAGYSRRRLIWTFVAAYCLLIVALAVPSVILVDVVIERWSEISTSLVAKQLISPMLTAFVALVTVCITAGLTYWGWRAVYEYNLKLEQRRKDNAVALEKRKTDRKLLEDQIEKLYAPLATLCSTRQAAMDVLLKMQKRDGAYFDGEKRTSEQMQEWRDWRIEVFMLILLQMQETILKNVHLLEGADMPKSFTKLLAHIAAYKDIIKRWADVIAKDKDDKTNVIYGQKLIDGEYDPVVPHTADENFSREFQKEIESRLKNLKMKLSEFDRSFAG